ncbi:hypothetical protein EDB86DRAFT_3080804 [Lactarius hatsudake]|nr:hypothetical protein EDB86DRAFT_3080804 [Lactarius hatsudake]
MALHLTYIKGLLRWFWIASFSRMTAFLGDTYIYPERADPYSVIVLRSQAYDFRGGRSLVHCSLVMIRSTRLLPRLSLLNGFECDLRLSGSPVIGHPRANELPSPAPRHINMSILDAASSEYKTKTGNGNWLVRVKEMQSCVYVEDVIQHASMLIFVGLCSADILQVSRQATMMCSSTHSSALKSSQTGLSISGYAHGYEVQLEAPSSKGDVEAYKTHLLYRELR